MNWTPGPWAVDGINDEVINCEPLHEIASTTAMHEGASVRVAGAFDIDECVFPDIGSASANAKLIALAPDMATALLAVTDPETTFSSDAWREAWQMVNSVSEKLRMIGEGNE